jgi:hypothetical protein
VLLNLALREEAERKNSLQQLSSHDLAVNNARHNSRFQLSRYLEFSKLIKNEKHTLEM